MLADYEQELRSIQNAEELLANGLQFTWIHGVQIFNQRDKIYQFGESNAVAREVLKEAVDVLLPMIEAQMKTVFAEKRRVAQLRLKKACEAKILSLKLGIE